MQEVTINYWAILMCGVASMVLGFVWYSMAVFGKPWMKLIGKTKEQIMDEMKTRSMPVIYGSTFVAAMVQAYILAHFLSYAGARSVVDGLVGGLWVGVGFVLATSLSGYLFENRPLKLYWINNGYTVVLLAIFGMILAVWK